MGKILKNSKEKDDLLNQIDRTNLNIGKYKLLIRDKFKLKRDQELVDKYNSTITKAISYSLEIMERIMFEDKAQEISKKKSNIQRQSYKKIFPITIPQPLRNMGNKKFGFDVRIGKTDKDFYNRYYEVNFNMRGDKKIMFVKVFTYDIFEILEDNGKIKSRKDLFINNKLKAKDIEDFQQKILDKLEKL